RIGARFRDRIELVRSRPAARETVIRGSWRRLRARAPSRTRFDHAIKLLQFTDLHAQTGLKASLFGGGAEEKPVGKIQLLCDQPEEWPQLDRGHEFDDLCPRFAEK